MTESTKEQIEKWRGEFESKSFLRARGISLPLDIRRHEKGYYESPTTDFIWMGYLVAKKSDFEEIELLKWQKEEYKKSISEFIGAVRTLKEQLAEAVKLARLGVYSVNGLLTHNHESWELSAESWLLKTKIFLEKQDKENKE